CRRVVMPAENEHDVPVDLRSKLRIIFAANVQDAVTALILPAAEHTEATLKDRKLALVESECAKHGWQLQGPKPVQSGQQFTVLNPGGGEMKISLYDSGAHTPKQHPNETFSELLTKLESIERPTIPVRPVQQTFKIADVNFRKDLQARFAALYPTEERNEPHCECSLFFIRDGEKTE